MSRRSVAATEVDIVRSSGRATVARLVARALCPQDTTGVACVPMLSASAIAPTNGGSALRQKRDALPEHIGCAKRVVVCVWHLLPRLWPALSNAR